MTTAGELRSGKGHRDENFPVASWLIDARHRGIILAFYEFVRVADDIADHATLKPEEKLAQLDRLEQNLLGQGDDNREAVRLRNALAERGLPPRHAQDLLTAFRMDVTKLRYKDWDDLIHYCSYSAMPVGRFVLDVHGESHATWAANDALCAALQINNHLQDCGKDFRDLNRVYIPLDAFAAAGAAPEELGASRASPKLLRCIHDLAARNELLLDAGRAVLGADREYAARARGRGHPFLRAPHRCAAAGARSVERTRAPQQGAIRALRALRRDHQFVAPHRPHAASAQAARRAAQSLIE